MFPVLFIIATAFFIGRAVAVQVPDETAALRKALPFAGKRIQLAYAVLSGAVAGTALEVGGAITAALITLALTFVMGAIAKEWRTVTFGAIAQAIAGALALLAI